MEHPYRPLFVVNAAALQRAPHHELRVAYGVLIAVSAIQLLSGAQVIAGLLGVAGGVAGFASTRRSSWTTCSSSS